MCEMPCGAPTACTCAHRFPDPAEDAAAPEGSRKRKAGGAHLEDARESLLQADGAAQGAQDVRTPPASVVRTLCAEGAERRIELGQGIGGAVSPAAGLERATLKCPLQPPVPVAVRAPQTAAWGTIGAA